ncbi:hypothetical protein [Jannaschia pohangensis]|uniref:Uncharacterized protein n=1 Tax=Jannaschia pohangensis TaxID=390807 RepID=A0A1I3LX07_9RHOB|nr:hypothetical protein [Jannaschia pohangensis]SFI89045.1 hypothetical protein SAMN04488095_1654 [Jannaschia pohangensis]
MTLLTAIAPLLDGQTLLILGLALAVILTSFAVVQSNARVRRHIEQDETRRKHRLQHDRAAQIVRPAPDQTAA